MPLYDYSCDSCGTVHEHLCRYEDPNPPCTSCGGPTTRQFPQPPYHKFREGWYEHIAPDPIYIKSMKQLERVCADHGVTSKYVEDSR